MSKGKGQQAMEHNWSPLEFQLPDEKDALQTAQKCYQGRLKEAGAIQKDLQLHNVDIASYYTDKYALWLDFRTIDDNRLHGSGRQLENTSEGITLQITKKAESACKLSCYLYIFQDAQINISGRSNKHIRCSVFKCSILI